MSSCAIQNSDYQFEEAVIHRWKWSILAGLEGAFDPRARLVRQRRIGRVVLFALLCGSAQEFNLLSITRTPDAQHQMNPQSDALQACQRMVKRLGLQADGPFAIGRQRAENLDERIHVRWLVGRSFQILTNILQLGEPVGFQAAAQRHARSMQHHP